MEKRLPLALLASLLFLWIYSSLYPAPSAPPATGDAAPQGTASASGAGDAARPSAPGPGAIPEPIAAAEPEVEGQPVPFAGTGFVAEFNTRGAGLSWLQLTDYVKEAGQDEPLRLVGHPLDEGPSLLLREFEGRYPLERVAWSVERGTTAEGRARLLFRWTAPDGLRFTRTVEDRGLPHAFALSLTVENTAAASAGGTLLLVQEGPRGLIDPSAGIAFGAGITALAVVRESPVETDVTTWTGGDLQSGAPRRIAGSETLLAAGTMTNYFAVVLAPGPATLPSLVQPSAVLDGAALEQAVAGKAPPDASEAELWRAKLAPEHRTNAQVSLLLGTTLPAPDRPLNAEFLVYAGPKERGAAARPELAAFLGPIIEDGHGSMAWINHALLAVLRFFHWACGNWGVAIVLLTLIVRVLLFPLNRVQQSSMAKYSATMQRLKPELDALKAKYKNNTRKFSEEQMKLLRAHGATPPLGGCLLMFLQFPIWISLFQILRTSIELRHAPFVGWVSDLSRPDAMPLPFALGGLEHLNLLPILMAAAMVLQMRLQPPPADPSQAQMQRIMGMLMPVMMLFFLYGYPSGLALYIFTSSVLGIFEYRLIRKYWPVPGTAANPEVVAAPAVRK